MPGNQPNKSFYSWILTFCILLSFYGQSTAQNSVPDIKNIKLHLDYLGSDRLQGRGTGTAGGKLASAYIASQLKAYNLLPYGDKRTYYQNIPMHGSRPLASSMLTVYQGKRSHELELGKDYLLYKTGAATFIPDHIPVVFAGYGIVAPEFDYNDYQSIDVEGKVVVYLSGEPPSDDINFFEGEQATVYSTPEAKQRLALSRGARGSIMIPLPSEDSHTEWQYWVNEFAFEHVTLAYTVSSHASILMYPLSAGILFQGALLSLEDVLNRHDQGRISSFDLQAKISFLGQFDERDFIDRNILAMRQGNDDEMNDTYIIVSAHYDHLGLGPVVEGDSIYNGALDNALGVATLIELARIFSKKANQTKRSILFLLTTGEEKGLLGSTYYTDHPVVPLYKTIANVNIDGIAAFEEFTDIIGVGSAYSSLRKSLEHTTEQSGLKVSEIPSEYFYESQNINRSDQFAFMKAGIPSVLLVEGVNYKRSSYAEGIQRMIKWNQIIYHTPFDDLHQPINYLAVKQHAKFIYSFINHLANNTSAPTWNEGAPFINARLQSIAEKR
jgi:hypothetical protein